ncbi:MAG TPA: dihydropteroate synthase, partial [Micromonosporaceae bacterium]|nr:dihydropteroate synthase [Micromonosporaceae bacterium]
MHSLRDGMPTEPGRGGPVGGGPLGGGPGRPIVMGVLNVTPDSFSDGGRYLRLDDALAHARTMYAQGAAIVDVGGESTRP